MIWGSFFAGAVGMLFVVLVSMFLLPERQRKEDELFRMQQDKNMLELLGNWERANSLAIDRNLILQKLVDK